MIHPSLARPLCLALVWACSGTDTPYIPGGGVARDSGGDSAGGGGPCPYTEWTAIGEVWVDPLTCRAWGPQEGSMDWYEAVSPEESIAGGCTSHCDNDGEGFCSDIGSIEGLTGDWQLPSISDLEELALRHGPFEPLDGDLWSHSSDTNMNQLAWTADLDQPGMEVTLDKGSGAQVRCMLDLGG